MPKIERFSERSNARQGVQSIKKISRLIKGMHGLRAAMKLTDLSYKRMGEEIARMEGRDRAYSKAMVHAWSTRRDHPRHARLHPNQLAALAGVMTEWAREESGVPQLVVSTHYNSPIRARMWIRCADCGTRVPLDLRRREWRRCQKCVRAA